MNRTRRIALLAVPFVLLALSASAAWAACTATFTADDSGTFGKTLQYDRKTSVLTVDLTPLLAGAEVFRAELVLKGRGRFHKVPVQPTTVYPVGQPDKKLKFVPPRFVSLDALDAVKAALNAEQPLKLKLEVTLAGADRLEVSYLQGKPKEKDIPTVSGVKVAHRAGQSLIVFSEPKLPWTASVAAPFDGPLQSVDVESGQAVKKGDLLGRLDAAALKRQLAEVRAQQQELLKTAEEQQRAGKRAEARVAQSEARKLDGRIKSLEKLISRAELRAPIDGTAAFGELMQRIGAPVKAGEKLFQVKGHLGIGSYPDFETGGDVGKLRSQLAQKHGRLRFRIWRGREKITPQTIAAAKLVGECGLMTCWNSGYHQGSTNRAAPVLYRVADGGHPVPWGTGIYAHNPAEAGKAYYAVTVAVAGEEDLDSLAAANTTAEAVEEVVGQGVPILQWVEQPKDWHYRGGPLTRLIYTRWEAWPHASTPSKPIDYLVAMGDEPMPEKPVRDMPRRAWRVEPAPVGLHLHCWGASLNGGYGWWHNAHRGAVLIASNQIPYDWWTGYHEANGTCKTYGDGFVRPFTMNRTFGILDWASRQWKEAPEPVRKHWRKLDLSRVFTAGSSMGGSGAPMYAIRHGDRVAWCIAWVGVHVPELSPQFKGSYQGNYGPRHEQITMADGRTSPWDHFSDVHWLRKNIKTETGFIMASNGKSDGGIGWPQAYQFARALQETRRPHLFNWGPGGHGTRTLIGSNFDLDVRIDQTLPAFTNCTVDNDIGTGTLKTKEQMAAERQRIAEKLKAEGKPVPKNISVLPTDGEPGGAYNAHLWWQTHDVVDEPRAWEMTVILKASAPADTCKVDLTPRRLQKFATPRGAKFTYVVTDLQKNQVLGRGAAEADEYDLLTLKQIPLVKGRNRVAITPAQ